MSLLPFEWENMKLSLIICLILFVLKSKRARAMQNNIGVPVERALHNTYTDVFECEYSIRWIISFVSERKYKNHTIVYLPISSLGRISSIHRCQFRAEFISICVRNESTHSVTPQTNHEKQNFEQSVLSSSQIIQTLYAVSVARTSSIHLRLTCDMYSVFATDVDINRRFGFCSFLWRCLTCCVCSCVCSRVRVLSIRNKTTFSNKNEFRNLFAPKQNLFALYASHKLLKIRIFLI